VSWRHPHSFLAGVAVGAGAVMDWRLLLAGVVLVFAAGWFARELAGGVRVLVGWVRRKVAA
jgi:hypothetical protein